MAVHSLFSLSIPSAFKSPTTQRIARHRFNNLARPGNIHFPRLSLINRFHRYRVIHAIEQNQESNEAEAEEKPLESPSALPPPVIPQLKEESDKVDNQLWSGVAEEISEIEWPAFGKVLGITGVVLSVIAGSSVVLLTVNAILAELSDRVFAGRGVQDFFG